MDSVFGVVFFNLYSNEVKLIVCSPFALEFFFRFMRKG